MQAWPAHDKAARKGMQSLVEAGAPFPMGRQAWTDPREKAPFIQWATLRQSWNANLRLAPSKTPFRRMRFPAENHKQAATEPSTVTPARGPAQRLKGQGAPGDGSPGVVALLGHSNELLPNRLFPNSHRLFLCYTFPCHSHTLLLTPELPGHPMREILSIHGGNMSVRRNPLFVRCLACLLLVLVFLLSVSLAKAQSSNTALLLRKPTVSRTQIAFSYGGDLWIVDRNGGEARRLTIDVGIESDPYFSPDGAWIAFTGEYDGNEDVFSFRCWGRAQAPDLASLQRPGRRLDSRWQTRALPLWAQ